MKNYPWLYALLGLILAAILAIYFVLPPPPLEKSDSPPTSPTPPRTPAQPAPTKPPTQDLTATQATPTTPPDSTSGEQPFDGDDAIAEILMDENITHSQAVSKLIALIPKLTQEQQEEAAIHIANLSEENDAAAWAKLIVQNALPDTVAEILFAELYNQPQEIFAPAAASIADSKGHPLAQEAADTLDVLYGPLEPNETWTSRINRELSDNPPGD